jgi:hypothetical protein
MSSLITDLVGHKCLLKTEDDEYLAGDPELPCRVTGTDGEWIRVSFANGEGGRLTRMVRVDALTDILVLE